jgi:hypothetical protein
VSSSRRSCKERRRSGQHHRGIAVGVAGKLILLLTSFTISAQAQALLHIRILEGEGTIHRAGSKSAGGIVVQITDETGKPVDGAAVSFRLPEEGPGAIFARGMRTEIAVTTPDGRAAAYGMMSNRIAGPFQVRVTAVKGEVRAGTIVSQFVSDQPVKGAQARKGGRRWMTIAAIVGSGAAAGILAGSMGGGKVPETAAAPPQVGAPTITVGRP